MRHNKTLFSVAAIVVSLTGCNEDSSPADPGPEPLPDPVAAFDVSGGTVTPATITFQSTSVYADTYLWAFGGGLQNSLHEAGRFPWDIGSGPDVYVDLVDGNHTPVTFRANYWPDVTSTSVQRVASQSMALSPRPAITRSTSQEMMPAGTSSPGYA